MQGKWQRLAVMPRWFTQGILAWLSLDPEMRPQIRPRFILSILSITPDRRMRRLIHGRTSSLAPSKGIYA